MIRSCLVFALSLHSMSQQQSIQFVECPRDAMQGWKHWIPTETKINYLKQLLKVGFHTLDFGSFVSAKAIPQMRDTHEVVKALENHKKDCQLLAIVANIRGAEEALSYSFIDVIGYPFSVSETFQLRNTNVGIRESFDTVKQLADLCHQKNRGLVVYLSMAFGNPYGDPWNAELVMKWLELISQERITVISLSDTIGVASPESISYLFSKVIPQYPQLEIGAHFHSTVQTCISKLEAAYKAGCRRFDGALKGLGGCPMAKDELVGNMPTELMIDYFLNQNMDLPIDVAELQKSLILSSQVFTLS